MRRLPLPSLQRIVDELNSTYDSEAAKVEYVDISEDSLSLKLVQSIRSVLTTPPIPNEHPERDSGIYLDVQAYKATGRLEQTHGDIAIIVTDTDRRITGTGFYEAKAEFKDHLYPSYKMRQIQRLESNTPRLAIAIYELSAKPVSDDPIDYSLPWRESGEHYQARSRCRVLPASWVRQFSSLWQATNLMQPCSFGHHFVSKYLLGKDLDYSRPPTAAIDRWIRHTRRASPIILKIVISRSPDFDIHDQPLPLLPGSSLMSVDFTELDQKTLDFHVVHDV
jgi:hypothetical protein